MIEKFDEQGYLTRLHIMDRVEAHRHLGDLLQATQGAPLDWPKGWAATSRPFYTLGCHPAIVSRVTRILGDDVLLWGAKLIHMAPGARHDWHSDLESSSPTGKTVSVWLALKDCFPESSLHVIPGSHKFGKTLQQVRAEGAVDRESADTDGVLRLAQEYDSSSNAVVAETHEGEALFFDGRLWHGSHNTADRTRSAVLLQYATPDTPIRIPKNHDWPYENLTCPLPPCVIISGRDHHQLNRIVPAPTAEGSKHSPSLTLQARDLALPISPGEKNWLPVPVFRGSTAGQHCLACHVSALIPGHSPHPPHRHEEEELLMVLHGEADIILPDLKGDKQRQRLRKGECVYYPAQFAHTIEGVSSEPVNYLMLKWLADPSGAEEPIGFQRWSFTKPDENAANSGIPYKILLGGPTRWLHKLQCHTTALASGVGYEAHTDGYDVVMIILEGTVESIGQSLSPHGVYFYAAGELHGAFNPGPGTAHYVVFEFHSLPSPRDNRRQKVPLIKKLTDPGRWKRRLIRLIKR